MPTPDLSDAVWRKSSRSNGQNGQCVEVAHITDSTGIRDSKDRDGGPLIINHASWTHFLTSIRADRFDRRQN